MSHPSTHIDLLKDVVSFKDSLFNRILIFNMELWYNNGIRDYLRLNEKERRFRILTTIVYLDIRSIFRYLISVHCMLSIQF